VSKAPTKVVTKNTIQWKVGVVFDDGDGKTLDLHPGEGRWRVLLRPDDDDDDDDGGRGPSLSSVPPPPTATSGTGEDDRSHSPRQAVASDEQSYAAGGVRGRKRGSSRGGDAAVPPRPMTTVAPVVGGREGKRRKNETLTRRALAFIDEGATRSWSQRRRHPWMTRLGPYACCAHWSLSFRIPLTAPPDTHMLTRSVSPRRTRCSGVVAVGRLFDTSLRFDLSFDTKKIG
jgi:hypothetical protein